MEILRRLSFREWDVLRRAATGSVAGLVLALVWIAPSRAQDAGIEGRRITQVRVIDETGMSVAEKIPALPLEEGKAFDFSDERESLRALYRLGDYSDIHVAATPEADGVRVEFIARRNLYYNVVRIEGLKSPPTAPAALAAMRLGLGEPYRESAFHDAIERLREALRDDGLYQAKITWALTPHEDTRQMDVTVTVEPGPRAHVGDVAIVNQTAYPDQQLLHRSKISRKKDVTTALLSRASQRLKKYLVDQGYLGAGVAITRGAYDPASNGVPLKLAVKAGPRVRIEISGARLSKSTQRKLLPIYAEGAVDEDLLQEGRRNIRDHFQSQGYFDVDVQVSSREPGEETDHAERTISYEIARGDRFRLAGVAFDGNNYFGGGMLERRLLLQPASFASSGRFSQQLLRADTDSMRALYLANGFRDAQVSATVDDRYQRKKNNLFVSFHVFEGEQTRVADLQIEGNRAIGLDTLLAVSGSTPGQPYSEAGVASDRNNILALYYNEGFPAAVFREGVSPGAKPNEVRVVYHIAEGNRIEVAKVLLTGYQYTRPGIIARQVEMQPGEPLRQGDVAKTQRQLYNLGIFNRVQIAPQNPEGANPEKAVVVEVQEGERYTVGYGVGFELQRISGGSTSPSGTILSASPRGLIEITRANAFGRAQSLTLKARASSLDYRVLLGFSSDQFLAKQNLGLQLTGLASKTQDINTFTSTRLEGGLQLVHQFSPASSVLYRYFYRRVQASDLSNTINPAQIPLLSQPTRVSGFGVTYARDRRDNPGDPTRGTFNTVDLSDAIQALGSGGSFFRGYFQNSSYYPLGKAFVFARSVRFGIEQPLGKTVSPNDPSCIPSTEGEISCTTIPLPERFFAGGGTSVRGFGLNQAGPRDPVTGFPVGGLALLVFNQELRFPMRLPLVGNRLGGTVFYDAGNVYDDISHITLAWKSSSLTRLNYFSHTVGLGLRYPTPIGPVRLDFGYQLNPAFYQANNATTNPLRLPHFQFFFNIGPVF